MTMPRPFRLLVLDALTAQIKKVSPANGYHFDVAEAVFRGRVWFGDDDPLPMVSILEPPLAIEQLRSQADNTGSEGDWDLLLQGWVPDDKSNPTDPAYAFVAEVIKSLAEAKTQKNGRTSDIFGLGAGLGRNFGIENMTIGAPVVRPADEVSARACFYLPVTFKIAEDMTNPFL